MEVTQQRDLGAVVDDLSVDVENQGREGTVRERALAAAPVVTSPHIEEGYLPPAEPAALAVRISARRGQEILFESELVGDTTSLVFVEAWRV